MPDAINYDALAKQHGAVPAGIDYDALAAKHGAVSDAAPSQQGEQPGAVSRFLQPLDPRPMVQRLIKGAGEPGYMDARVLAKNAVGILKDLGMAQIDMGKKAIEAFHKGDHIEAAAKGLSALVPILGPMSQQAADKFYEGDTAGGLGTLTAMALPEVAKEAKGAGAVASTVAKGAGKVAGKAASIAGKVVENPAGRDVVGLISPRAAHAQNIALRVKGALEIFSGNKPTDATQSLLDSIRREAKPPEVLWKPGEIRPSTRSAPVEPPPALEAPPVETPVKKAPNAFQRARLDAQAKQQETLQRLGKPKSAEPTPEVPQPDAVKPPETNLVTIPSPKPRIPPEKYANTAREAKALELAKVLHQFEIPHADALLMESADWGQAAKAAGVKTPSALTISRALIELKKLEKVTSIKRELANEFRK